MTIRQRVQQIARTLRSHLELYTALFRDPRTPRPARWLLGTALAYVAFPFDLIPDFLPVIGHLDDVIIVPGLIVLALHLIPTELYEEHYTRLMMPHRPST
jgi:uncharacterized membrane protein YkvA (DUF1232 family)